MTSVNVVGNIMTPKASASIEGTWERLVTSAERVEIVFLLLVRRLTPRIKEFSGGGTYHPKHARNCTTQHRKNNSQSIRLRRNPKDPNCKRASQRRESRNLNPSIPIRQQPNTRPSQRGSGVHQRGYRRRLTLIQPYRPTKIRERVEEDNVAKHGEESPAQEQENRKLSKEVKVEGVHGRPNDFVAVAD